MPPTDARRTGEIDVLYTISNKLTQASTPADWLDAVSDYARAHGATSGLLLYLHMQEFRPDVLDYAEIVAVWTHENAKAGALGTRYYGGEHDDFAQAFMSHPARPLLIPDILDSEQVHGPTLELFSSMDLRGMAVLPLNVKGRWVAELVFGWNAPYRFSAIDQRIYTAIIQQAGPVIESMRLYERILERAARTEILLAINTALSRATCEAEILGALALLTDRDPPHAMALMYLDRSRPESELVMTIMAVWQAGRTQDDHPRLGVTFSLHDDPFAQVWLSTPGQCMFVGDTHTDPRVVPQSRDRMATIGIRALGLLPLYSYGRWQGIVSIEWETPHEFTATEQYVYQMLLHTLPSVVASRRAYLDAEDARQERTLLYDASQGINAARSYEEIVDALVRLDLEDLSIALWVWDHYDLARADYMQLVAKSDNNAWPLGTRLRTDSVPLVHNIECDSLIVVEDTADLARNDPVTAATTESRGYHALLSVPLCLDGRFMGLLGFETDQPRIFNAHEKRLAAGIGELVTAAVDRMRLKEETDRLNERAQEMAALEERNRLARELHDSVSQSLYGIALGTRTAKALLQSEPGKVAEPLDYVLSLAEAGLKEMRALIFELRPELLANEGLTVALTSQLFSLETRHNIQVEAELCDEPDASLEVKETIYRIAREALHNIIKHAKASYIHFRLVCESEGILLSIADDGAGFDPSVPFPGHLGLQSMRERAARMAGTFTIESAPGQGTQVTLHVPLT